MGIADGYNMLAAQEAERHKERERNERVAELVKSALVIEDQWRVAYLERLRSFSAFVPFDEAEDAEDKAEWDRVASISAAADPLWKQVRELLGLPPTVPMT